MVGWNDLKGRGGDKDLIAPKDGEAAGARGGVDASLAHNSLEYGDGFKGAVGELVTDGEFLLYFGDKQRVDEEYSGQNLRQKMCILNLADIESLPTHTHHTVTPRRINAHLNSRVL